MRSCVRFPFCLGLAATAVAFAVLAACGGSTDAGAASTQGVESRRVVALNVEGVDDELVVAAAREHGAPGDAEPVVYRVRAGDPATVRAAIALLVANGYASVEAE